MISNQYDINLLNEYKYKDGRYIIIDHEQNNTNILLEICMYLHVILKRSKFKLSKLS